MTLPASTSSRLLPAIPGYTIVEQLYLGSRTAVYRAVQMAPQCPVVIKVLRHDRPSFIELVQFRNQYTITKNLPIPGIVQPLSLEPLGSGYALVMEDCGEVALGRYIQQESLGLTEILAIALQLADILHGLCQHGVVHKDIKPANILIHPESKQVKLIDFSIASLLPKETQEIQNPNVLEGTLAYLAPEQTGRMNRGIDYRADFYALGVTLYQLLTGMLPFISDDPLELVHCHMAKMPVPVDQVKADMPAMIAAIVTKLMAKNAEDRYQSALGLKHDLEQCLSEWQATGLITAFELGQRDLGDRFLIPEKLYGRAAEVQSLLEAFDRVAHGSSELMLVAGFSGIGKTAVVNEVHKPIVCQRGYFIKGKFDQFNRNIPLSGFVQALRDLMGQLLSEADEQLMQWQTEILSAVGENGQVLLDVIPELEQIIGQQPPAPELSGSTAQNRFNLLFQKFIKVFTTAKHPLVLFLDDLQWADVASLQLIKLLMNDNGYLLILGAYRDNEVSPAHPFILTVEELKKAQVITNTINLTPLAFDDINHLVADTLNCKQELAQPLTQLIDRKTKGNPFFTTQFLKALHEDGQILFNRNLCYWECDISQVNTLTLTDDVVEFMALQLQKLPAETQRILKLAACVGNQFDLATLAIVSEQLPTEAATALWKALQEGLILPTNQVYKFFHGPEQSASQELVNPAYRFLHDRIQQAAYCLIPHNQRQHTHLCIGQLLLKNVEGKSLEANIFEIVNHLNLGIPLITQSLKKAELANLNLMAGQKAKAAIAYEAALGYFKIGLDLLTPDCWQIQYDLALILHELAGEAACLLGDYESMQQLTQAVLSNAHHSLDQIKSHQIQIQGYAAQAKNKEVMQTALSVLQTLGIEMPKQPSQLDTQHKLEQVSDSLSEKCIEDLVNLDQMTDPKALAIMQILSAIIPVVFDSFPQFLPLVVLTKVDLSIRLGNATFSPFAYALYGVILCGVIGDIDTGYQFGQLAIRLLDRLHIREARSSTLFIVHGVINHWKQPIKEILSPLSEAYLAGLEYGDLEHAAWSISLLSFNAYLAGTSLNELEKEMVLRHRLVQQTHQERPAYAHAIFYQAVLSLMGSPTSPCHLIGQQDDDDAVMGEIPVENHDLFSLCHLYTNKLMLSVLFQDYSQATEDAQKAVENLEGAVGFPLVPVVNFYGSLVQLANYAETTQAEQSVILEKVAVNQDQLEQWASHAPANYLHKFSLVEAQRQQVLGNRGAAIDLYDRAIAGAKANGYIQEEALANELAARFYLDWGKPKIAQEYLTNAYYGYVHWGAKAKVQDLERRYPQLLAPILPHQQMALSATETVFATTSLAQSQAPGTQSSSSDSISISATFDLATIFKASQTLSSEIQFDKLLATLLYTVLENAGADKGALLMPRDNQWFVEAIATLDRPAQVQSVLLANSPEVTHGLINIVKRSLQPMVIVDATIHSTLATDPYIMQKRPKSLLCTPILQQGKLVAILYLENQITIGAFTRDRIEIIQLLISQAAISLENARLYRRLEDYSQNLEAKVAQRTQELQEKHQHLKQTQTQLIQAEKMSALGQMVAGIAHEINNPINFIHGNISHTCEYFKDILNLLALYEQECPHPSPTLQNKIKEIDLIFLKEDLNKLLFSMETGSDRIRQIVLGLRNFSRLDESNMKQVDIHEGLENTLLLLQHRLTATGDRPAIAILKNYGKLPLINCYASQLNQVFFNIITNAIDVLATSDASHCPEICITTEIRDSKTIRVVIADNGLGMSESVCQKIFDPFFTTKPVGQGTGLGLSISYQIVTEKHRGQLHCISHPGRGTEFAIDIPMRQSVICA
jgi:predicted ATPase/signal transduction histidine kinase